VAPKDASTSRSSTAYAGPPQAAPPGTNQRQYAIAQHHCLCPDHPSKKTTRVEPIWASPSRGTACRESSLAPRDKTSPGAGTRDQKGEAILGTRPLPASQYWPKAPTLWSWVGAFEERPKTPCGLLQGPPLLGGRPAAAASGIPCLVLVERRENLSYLR